MIVIFSVGVARAALAQPYSDEDGDDPGDEQRLDDRAADAAVPNYPRESSHNPPTVYPTINASMAYCDRRASHSSRIVTARS